MPKAKRPFRKLKGIDKSTDDYAIKNDRRTYMFNFNLPCGGAIESTGTVPKEKVEELVKIYMRLRELGE